MKIVYITIIYKIGALKVFAHLGALIEEDELNEIKFLDIPTDVKQNNILNHLKMINY